MKVRKINCFLTSIFVLLLCISATKVQAQNEDHSKPQELVDKSITVLKGFASKKEFENFFTLARNAKGIFLVPQMLKGGFVVGGSGGSGVLVANDGTDWSYPAFYTMGAVSIGLQIGAESSQIMLLVMTEKGMDSMLSNSFKLGADATIAVGPVGTGAKAATADILSFSLSKGAYTGVSLEGAVITSRDSWNETYYGKPVRPKDIFIQKSVTNPGAEELRNELKRLVQQ